MKTDNTNRHPLKEGNKRYVVVYRGLGVKFKTEVDGKDRETAKAYFTKFYPSATMESMQLKR